MAFLSPYRFVLLALLLAFVYKCEQVYCAWANALCSLRISKLYVLLLDKKIFFLAKRKDKRIGFLFYHGFLYSLAFLSIFRAYHFFSLSLFASFYKKLYPIENRRELRQCRGIKSVALERWAVSYLITQRDSRFGRQPLQRRQTFLRPLFAMQHCCNNIRFVFGHLFSGCLLW